MFPHTEIFKYLIWLVLQKYQMFYQVKFEMVEYWIDGSG